MYSSRQSSTSAWIAPHISNVKVLLGLPSALTTLLEASARILHGASVGKSTAWDSAAVRLSTSPVNSARMTAARLATGLSVQKLSARRQAKS